MSNIKPDIEHEVTIAPILKQLSVADYIYLALGLSMIIYFLISTQVTIQGSIGQQNTHLLWALLILFIAGFRKRAKHKYIFLLLIVFTLFSTGYVQIYMDHLSVTTQMGELKEIMPYIVGIILIILPLVACYLLYGPVLPIVALAAIAYLALGQYLPGNLGHSTLSFERILIGLSISLTSGVYGSFLQASISFVFLFIIFGSVLQVCGGSKFIIEICKVFGRHIRGGAAQSAVWGSCLVGTITGSSMANVAIVGPVTIPIMKSYGFKSEFAGAVEAAASTGGQIMPPIMGVAAFLMAGLLGIPYAEIMLKGFLPAILYFLGLGIGIYFISCKYKIPAWHGSIDKRSMLSTATIFLVPLALIVYLLLIGYSVNFCAFTAILTCFCLSLFRKETRPGLRVLADNLAKGAETGSGIAISLTVLGLIAATLSMTGLGLKIPSLLVALSGGNLIIALFCGFIALMILGCGLHTAAVYLIGALTIAPGLVYMGVNIIAAHFFIMYVGILSNITPPVATACIVASSIAQSNYMSTCLNAMKLVVAGYLVPFACIWCGALLADFNEPFSNILALISLTISIGLFSAAGAGYLLKPINWLERLVVFILAVGFYAFTVTVFYPILWASLVMLIMVVIFQVTSVNKYKLKERST